ncbi:hypothetical protein SLE2022_295020 [Rubroshorea leprosula]
MRQLCIVRHAFENNNLEIKSKMPYCHAFESTQNQVMRSGKRFAIHLKIGPLIKEIIFRRVPSKYLIHRMSLIDLPSTQFWSQTSVLGILRHGGTDLFDNEWPCSFFFFVVF